MAHYIVTGPCQSQKSWACFNVVDQLCKEHPGAEIDLVFISQANNSRIVQQTLGRMKTEATISSNFGEFVYASGMSKLDLSSVGAGNTCYVGFWHSNTRKNIFDVVMTRPNKHRILVIDEAEQGGMIGTYERLKFAAEICGDGKAHVILITATIANLSRCAEKLLEAAQEEDLIWDFLKMDWHVRHVEVSSDYIGMQWYKDQGLVTTVTLPKGDERIDAACDVIEANTSDEKREIALVCVSTRTEDHNDLCGALMRRNLFNVTVQLNSGELSKSYIVYYVNGEGDVKEWHLPYERVCSMARAGRFAETLDIGIGRKVATLWCKGSIPPMPYILQAALRVGTQCNQKIKDTVSSDLDWVSLMSLYGSIERPVDYPVAPRIAVVAGHMASRGMTLTSKQAAFVYSAYLFGDSVDSGGRGATNTQRMGRCYGNIMSTCDTIRPVVLATEKCLVDALANEHVAAGVHNKECVKLADFVDVEDWLLAQDKAMRAVDVKIKTNKQVVALHDVKPVRAKKDMGAVVQVTEYERLGKAEFADKYIREAMRDTFMNTVVLNARAVAQGLKDAANVNLSFTAASANKVANIRNYYVHPEWSGKGLHMIWKRTDPEFVTIIKRLKEVLDAPELPEYIGAHNENGDVVVYKNKKVA